MSVLLDTPVIRRGVTSLRVTRVAAFHVPGYHTWRGGEASRKILARKAIELFGELKSTTECWVLWWILGLSITVNRACDFRLGF